MATACFTFDNLGEAAEIGEGVLAGPVPGGHPSLTTGLPAVLDLLAIRGIRSSFFVEGWNGVHHPDAVSSIAAAGHDVGMHGWVHEAWSTLDESTEALLAERATDALAEALGARPTGFRAPGGATTPRTERELRGLGYEVDASLRADGGHAPARLSGGLPNVPFVWPAVDGYWYLRSQPEEPSVVRDTWLAQLDRATSRDDGFFLLICHPFITGVDPARLDALDAVIAAAVADPRVEVCTVAEVAAALA